MKSLQFNGLWIRWQRWRMRRISLRIQRLNQTALALFARLQRIRDDLNPRRQ